MEQQNKSILEKLIYRDSNLNYKQIFDLKKNNEIEKYYNLQMAQGENYFYIQDFNRTFFDYFFYQPITVQYSFVDEKGNNNQILFKNIYSTEQLEKDDKIKDINNSIIVFEDIKIDFYIAKRDIHNYIKNNILIIINDNYNYDDNFIFDENIIVGDKFEKQNLSKYFDNYFIYNIKEEKNFEYEKTNSRKSLLAIYIDIFMVEPNLRFFKFCRPSSTGKSTTLLKFSRAQRGIVYLNIKAIHELDKNNRLKECYNLITYELRRLYISDEQKKNSFIKVLKECRNQNPWDIIFNVIKCILETTNIIIFDQIKKSYLYGNIYNQIEDYVKNSKLKLIICISINNKDIRDEVIKTIEQYKGNPKIR